MNQTICERCLNCKYLSKTWDDIPICRLLCSAPIEKLDKCILDYDAIKNIMPDSFEDFMLRTYPKSLLQFIAKNQILAVGDTVVVLDTIQHPVESAKTGDILTVSDVHFDRYTLTDGKHEYTAYCHNWYLHLFKLEQSVVTEDSTEKLYAVRVEETLARTYIVYGASSLNEAIENVQQAYDNDEIVLECDDMSGSNISASTVFENGIVPADRDVSYYEHFHCDKTEEEI